MIRRLENELVAAEQQRKDTINEFNSLKASMNNSDVAAKEHIVYFTSKVIFRSPSRPKKNFAGLLLISGTFVESNVTFCM